MVKEKKKAGLILLWAVTAAFLGTVMGWYILGDLPREVSVTPLAQTEGETAFFALDLNTATAPELEELPGIGPVLGSRIIAWREENGPFTGPEDVMAVPGIGPAIWEAIAPYIDFS